MATVLLSILTFLFLWPIVSRFIDDRLEAHWYRGEMRRLENSPETRERQRLDEERAQARKAAETAELDRIISEEWGKPIAWLNDEQLASYRAQARHHLRTRSS